MNPLLVKTLLRFLLFHAYVFFVAWIFTLIEKRDESPHERMQTLLTELRKEVAINNNMTDEAFNKFVKKASEAIIAGDELGWNFLNSCGFVFATLTTIGFGNITPKTGLGQGFTVVFSIPGIPLTLLALKSSGELMANCIRFLVIKGETGLLKRATPHHIKRKVCVVANALIALIIVLLSVCSIFVENWSFLEGLYAWCITLTTIGFGDYIHLESLARKVDHGEISEASVLLYGIIFCLPITVGLSLVSCSLTCLVDSMDQTRDFRDRYIKCCPSFSSLIQIFLFRKRISYDITARENHVCNTSRERRQEDAVSRENRKPDLASEVA